MVLFLSALSSHHIHLFGHLPWGSLRDSWSQENGIENGPSVFYSSQEQNNYSYFHLAKASHRRPEARKAVAPALGWSSFMGLERQEEMFMSTCADNLWTLSYYDTHMQTYTDPEPAGFAD